MIFANNVFFAKSNIKLQVDRVQIYLHIGNISKIANI